MSAYRDQLPSRSVLELEMEPVEARPEMGSDVVAPDEADVFEPAVLFSRLRPGRFVKKYSHAMLRLSHLEHVGFCLGHLTLDTAQAWQLSRSLELRHWDRGPDPTCVPASLSSISFSLSLTLPFV